MIESITTLTANAITAIAFHKAIEETAGESGKKLTGEAIAKGEELQELIWNRLAGKHPDLETTLEKSKSGEKEGIATVVKFLKAELLDKTFAKQVQAIIQEIYAAKTLDQSLMTQNILEGTKEEQENLKVASTLYHRAGLYYSQRKFGEAEPLFIDALRIRQKFLGPEHPAVALTQWNLGMLYQKQRRYVEAKTLYRQALAIIEATLGLNHPQTQGIRNSLKSLPINI